MKKILTLIILSVFSVNQSFAVNGNDYINHYGNVQIGSSDTYNIPTGYDLYIETSGVINDPNIVPGGTDAQLQATDSGSIVFAGVYSPGTTTQASGRIYRDDLTIVNVGNKEFSYIWNGYLFLEGSVINRDGVPLIGNNGAIVQEYEFLRQNELYNFYEMELLALLFLTLIVLLRRFSFNDKKISFK